MENTRIFWLRDQAKRPVACIASRRDEEGKFLFALAACSPKDIFDKARGRNIALGRLEKSNGHTYSINPKDNPKRSLMETLASTFGFPTDVQKAAKHWLRTHQVSI